MGRKDSSAQPEPDATAATLDLPALDSGGPSGDIPMPEAPEGAQAAPGSQETGPGSPVSDEGAPKRRRTRRKPPEPPAASAAPSPEEIAALSSAMGATIGVGFDMVARSRGAHWRLGADDKAELGALWGTALAPYMGIAGKYAPLIAAAFKTWERIDARLEIDSRRQVLPEGVGVKE